MLQLFFIKDKMLASCKSVSMDSRSSCETETSTDDSWQMSLIFISSARSLLSIWCVLKVMRKHTAIELSDITKHTMVGKDTK